MTKTFLLTKFHPSFKNDSHTALPDRRSFPQGYVKISRAHYETTVIYHIEKRAHSEIAHFEKIVIYHFEGTVCFRTFKGSLYVAL